MSEPNEIKDDANLPEGAEVLAHSEDTAAEETPGWCVIHVGEEN